MASQRHLESCFHLETLCCHMGNTLVMSALYFMERDPQHLSCHCSAKSGQELNVHEAWETFSAREDHSIPAAKGTANPILDLWISEVLLFPGSPSKTFPEHKKCFKNVKENSYRKMILKENSKLQRMPPAKFLNWAAEWEEMVTYFCSIYTFYATAGTHSFVPVERAKY